MLEIWEELFKDKQEVWGFTPAKSAILTKDFFIEHHVKNFLIPGMSEPVLYRHFKSKNEILLSLL